MTAIIHENNECIYACASCSQSKVQCDRIKTGLPFCSRCLRRGTACEDLVRTKKRGRPHMTDSQKQEAAIERKRRAQFPDLYPPSRPNKRSQKQQQQRSIQQSFSPRLQQQLFVNPQQLLLEVHVPQKQEQQHYFLHKDLLPQPFEIHHLQLQEQQEWCQQHDQYEFQQPIQEQLIQQPLQQSQHQMNMQEVFEEAEWDQ